MLDDLGRIRWPHLVLAWRGRHMMRYLAWRSRAGTGGGGGDDLAEVPRMPSVVASVVRVRGQRG